MNRVANPIDEPDEFDAKCRQKGQEWLAANPGAKRPKDLWSPFRLDLAKGFQNRCGFGAMWISSGTVDHFISCDEDSSKAYEWSNYRYIEGWINSSKKKHPSNELLDPFEVQEGWFEVDLPSLQLKLTDAVPAAARERAEFTLKRLKLRDDERIVRQRRAWYELYQTKDLTLEGLRKMAPLIAAAVERQLAAAAA
ncbi:hypothetical protein [Variovorax sp. JS1663]|uniref:hypothetical protein n=1 Tax=Variovorax sp. JS1663 TaxID=1851577 RepID=UPI000B341C32|nr:hypothetical protein [Variovorax sp. JS1663]OUM00867.1 hypothetical protein A8M77_19460 [Variovorax sp. JS1663]